MKWRKVVYATIAGAAFLGSAMVLPAIAATPINPPQDQIPGSFLVCPLFDISTGNSTTIRVTDVSGGNISGPGEDGPFSVRVHIDVICKGTKSDTRCNQNNDERSLTFHQTTSINVSDLVADPVACTAGYVVLFAQDPNGNVAQPIAYNNLIGSYHVGPTAADSATYGGNCIAFQANPVSLPGAAPTPIGRFLIPPTDDLQLSFGDTSPESDYVAFPRYLVSNFRGETSTIKTEIVLLTLPNNAPDAGASETVVNINYWNEEERIKSASHRLWCWDRVELNDLDQHFNAGSLLSQLGSDVGVLKVSHTGLPLLGVIIETDLITGGTVARNMQHFGTNPAAITYRPE